MMIGGVGTGYARADHRIGITEKRRASLLKWAAVWYGI